MTAKILSQQHRFIRLSVVFAVLLLFISGLPVAVSESGGEEQSSYFSAEYIQKIIDNTPATDPSLMDQVRANSKTVAVSGTIPAMAKGEESYQWGILLQGVLKKINADGSLSPYLWDNGGAVIGYGSYDSYIQISVHAEADLSDEEINALIRIVSDAGKEYGIDNIPIVIEKRALAQGFVPASSSNAPVEPKTIPGVGLLVCGILVLGTVLISRRKN